MVDEKMRFGTLPPSPPKEWLFLNDYFPSEDRLRIERQAGGIKCHWHEKITMKRMQETKRYLDSIWSK